MAAMTSSRAVPRASEMADADVESTLVKQAARGDADAFGQLMEGRIDRLLRTACVILGSEADARDALQDTCLSAWRELPRLRDSERLDAWLNRVLLNACRMRLRQRSRMREIPILPIHDEAVRPGDDPAMHDRIEEIDRAFSRLKADDRAILVLHHLERQPLGTIAASLGIPVGTLKWRLHAARAALARALEDGRR
jgi:RNA polymerase sigma-70 factor, ECF subfamily